MKILIWVYFKADMISDELWLLWRMSSPSESCSLILTGKGQMKFISNNFRHSYIQMHLHETTKCSWCPRFNICVFYNCFFFPTYNVFQTRQSIARIVDIVDKKAHFTNTKLHFTKTKYIVINRWLKLWFRNLALIS